jgi:proteasome lid subunit RPN8/RPN11
MWFGWCIGLTTVKFEKSVVDSILSHALDMYPREAILLLRGKKKKDEILVDEIVVPPLATHGVRFSAFPSYMLPMDLRIMGVSHSHPSGNPHPSVQDLNHIYGRIMVIAAYPFQSYSDIAVFDKDGNGLRWQLTSDPESNSH